MNDLIRWLSESSVRRRRHRPSQHLLSQATFPWILDRTYTSSWAWTRTYNLQPSGHELMVSRHLTSLVGEFSGKRWGPSCGAGGVCGVTFSVLLMNN